MAFFDRQDNGARLRTYRAQARRPTLVGLFERLVRSDEGPAPDSQSDQQGRADEPYTTSWPTRVFCLELLLQTGFQIVTNRGKRRRITLERAQRLPHLKVDTFECLLEHGLEFTRSATLYHPSENGLRT